MGVPKISRYAANNIFVGKGYSKDTQQLTAQQCYNVVNITTSQQQSYIKLGQASSSLELESELGISMSVSGTYDEFSGNAKASYVRSFQDNDYSISLNYHQYATNEVTAQLAGPGIEALTESGKSLYKNGKNPYFGLICGDHYISSYRQGALLTMGLYITFSSSVAKTGFEQEAGASFDSIMTVTESIKWISSNRQFTGSISIQAFQMGGDPTKLSQIFKKNSTGDYYALTCSFTEMDSCTQTASGLLDYAANNFVTQFSFEKNIGLTPQGIAFSDYKPIKWIGLTPPKSLVTYKVEQNRKELSNKLRENEYYRQKLYPFLNNGYPVKLDHIFTRNASSLLSKVSDNLDILFQSHGGAVDCYNHPDECQTVKDRIDSQLKNIIISDLTFFYAIKYMLIINDAIWYNKGVNTETSWDIVFNEPNKDIVVQRVSVTSEHFQFDLKSNSNKKWRRIYEGVAQSNSTYVGQDCILSKKPCPSMMTRKVLSPYFFEVYNLNGAMNKPDSQQVQNKNKFQFSFVLNN